MQQAFEPLGLSRKLRVRARSHQRAGIQFEDEVATTHRTGPMCYQNDGALPFEIVDRRHDLALGEPIECARRLIQNQ